MKINRGSQSGAVNPRAFAAFLLCAASGFFAMLSFAANPATGTLTDTSGPISYQAGPFTGANETPLPQLDVGPRCDGALLPCDHYVLTVTLPSGYIAANPTAAVRVTMSWTDTGSGHSDYDIYIYPNPDSECDPNDCSTTGGNETPIHQSSTSANPEVAIINPLKDGTQQYTFKIVPVQPTGETVTVTMELLPGSGSAGIPFGGPDPTKAGDPRYQIFNAPGGSSAQSSQGEFNIGFNPKSGRIMTMNTGPIWRITPPEVLDPKQPECCEGLWEDKSANTTTIGLDPILWTDQKTGRTFASNSTVGANAVYAYSDDDGDSWIEGGFSPPNGGADHETIGSGPYPALLSALSNPVNQGEAVYYCSQDLVGSFCQRSDDLGASYGPGVSATGNGIGSMGCGGLHGHVHVAPDGTVWLPDKSCKSGMQGGAVSTNAGVTWNEFVVTGSASQQQGADPSIAIDSDSSAYYCYVNNESVPPGSPPEGHAHCKVSKDHGQTWSNDVDLGFTHGVLNAAEIEAVGGSSARAACGFFGSNAPGDYQSSEYPGKWYVFIATTYDGGQSWTTVNATPNDPVQSRTGIWQQGGGNEDRNLLDFNEITLDNKGRVLYGYSDGCVTTGCIAGTAPNDFVGFMRVARQSGGKTLLDTYDANTDTTTTLAPKASCLSGTRNTTASYLSWKAPDNGGSEIVNYQIFRGTTSGGEALIGETGNAKTTFNDTTADPSVNDYFYYVKAINGTGTGPQSNEIDLVPIQPPPPENVCATPGLTQLTDPSGDDHVVLGLIGPPVPGSDLLSFTLAQPYAPDNDIKLIFTINTDPGQSPQPPGSGWYVAMKIPGPDPDISGDTAQFHYRGVRMDWNGVAPTFSIYTPTQNASGGTDGRFVGSTKPADPSSTYASPFNAVVIVAKASELGLKAGDQISGFLAGVSQSAAGRITELMDQMPDSLAFTASERYGPYTVNSNQLCRPNSPPTAVLTATPTSGTAPLTVHFDGSGSYDPDTAPPPDTIASYTFDFGDGSQPVTQSTPTISHTYSNPGNYPARLSVTDSRGLASLNTAEVTIQAVSPPPTITGVSASPTNIQEGSSATYTISISPAVFQPVTVNYSMSGKATQGSDYTLTGPAGKVTIPGGQTSATVRLNALIDNVKEKPETAIMTIQPGSGYQLATSTGKKKKSKAPSATVTISD